MYCKPEFVANHWDVAEAPRRPTSFRQRWYHGVSHIRYARVTGSFLECLLVKHLMFVVCVRKMESEWRVQQRIRTMISDILTFWFMNYDAQVRKIPRKFASYMQFSWFKKNTYLGEGLQVFTLATQVIVPQLKIRGYEESNNRGTSSASNLCQSVWCGIPGSPDPNRYSNSS